MMYKPNKSRYSNMEYRRAGSSGLKLSAISLGLWHNFGSVDNFDSMRDTLLTAFDNGITMFDLANNYGPVPGSAEENFGKILKNDLKPYRDEMLISTKAGYGMWEGPYGDGGSRKYMLSSLDQSLKRMGLDYVDIYYHHVPDNETPVEETCLALSQAVRSGKALYVAISNYNTEFAKRAVPILKELKCPVILNQVCYNLFNRWVEEDGLNDYAKQEGFGLIIFSPLAQGLLTDKYIKGIPENSRMTREHFLRSDARSEDYLKKVTALNELALNRGQTLAQMSVSWLLKNDNVTSVIVGASSAKQLKENISVNTAFTQDELNEIEAICTK